MTTTNNSHRTVDTSDDDDDDEIINRTPSPVNNTSKVNVDSGIDQDHNSSSSTTSDSTVGRRLFPNLPSATSEPNGPTLLDRVQQQQQIELTDEDYGQTPIVIRPYRRTPTTKTSWAKRCGCFLLFSVLFLLPAMFAIYTFYIDDYDFRQIISRLLLDSIIIESRDGDGLPTI